jgi:cobalt transporter subunit CbtB
MITTNYLTMPVRTGWFWRINMQNTQSTTLTNTTGLSVSNTTQIFAALGLGLALALFVGFAPMDVIHNAAHDARHAFAFPCH